jgi:hypothetical protein
MDVMAAMRSIVHTVNHSDAENAEIVRQSSRNPGSSLSLDDSFSANTASLQVNWLFFDGKMAL